MEKKQLKYTNFPCQLGLRTLTIAQKFLTLEEFKSFDEDLKEAQRALEDREGKVFYWSFHSLQFLILLVTAKNLGRNVLKHEKRASLYHPLS